MKDDTNSNIMPFYNKYEQFISLIIVLIRHFYISFEIFPALKARFQRCILKDYIFIRKLNNEQFCGPCEDYNKQMHIIQKQISKQQQNFLQNQIVLNLRVIPDQNTLNTSIKYFTNINRLTNYNKFLKYRVTLHYFIKNAQPYQFQMFKYLIFHQKEKRYGILPLALQIYYPMNLQYLFDYFKIIVFDLIYILVVKLMSNNRKKGNADQNRQHKEGKQQEKKIKKKYVEKDKFIAPKQMREEDYQYESTPNNHQKYQKSHQQQRKRKTYVSKVAERKEQKNNLSSSEQEQKRQKKYDDKITIRDQQKILIRKLKQINKQERLLKQQKQKMQYQLQEQRKERQIEKQREQKRQRQTQRLRKIEQQKGIIEYQKMRKRDYERKKQQQEKRLRQIQRQKNQERQRQVQRQRKKNQQKGKIQNEKMRRRDQDTKKQQQEKKYRQERQRQIQRQRKKDQQKGKIQNEKMRRRDQDTKKQQQDKKYRQERQRQIQRQRKRDQQKRKKESQMQQFKEKQRRMMKQQQIIFQKAKRQQILAQENRQQQKKRQQLNKKQQYEPSKKQRPRQKEDFQQRKVKEHQKERDYNRNKEDKQVNNENRANKIKNSNNLQVSRQRNYCQQYLKHSCIDLQRDDYGLHDEIKKIKKIIIEDYNKSGKSNFRGIHSQEYPIIFFRYEQNGRLFYVHIRNLLKQFSKLKDRRQVFTDIFNRIFTKVTKKFINLAVFAIEKGKEIKLEITKHNIFNLNSQEGSEIMFYFSQTLKKEINFTLIDNRMRIIQFDSMFIANNRSKHPDEFKLYEKFESIAFKENQHQSDQEDGIDLFNNEQMQSDEDQKRQFEQMTFHDIKEKIIVIINKNVDQFEIKIQRKEAEYEVEFKRSRNAAHLKRLKEQIEEYKENLDNFNDTRYTIADQMELISQEKHIFKKYLKKLIIAEKQLESQLPILGRKKEILKLLSRQNLVIIEGETGSGKSTQLPQILCEYYKLFDDHNAKPVLVTQPRRLATRSLAQRVAKQMGENVGGFVDYVASAGRKAYGSAKIIFKLDRIALDELTIDPILSKYSCLVIDQAHERTISIDVIVGLIKQLLQKRKDFKVIITSASMDIQLFQKYFQSKALKVSGRMYPVSIMYKDYANFKRGDKNEMRQKIKKVINTQILTDFSNIKKQFKGNILCFCSNVEQITDLVKYYETTLNKNVFSVYPLHGKITLPEQQKVFQDNGKYKIIFASRIAETAITIDGVKVVIDPGQDYELVYDQKYKISSMKLQDISQSSALQRAGRSGRTGPGHCFRLFSQQNFKKRRFSKVPEIQNSSLQTVVLRLKALKIQNVIKFAYLSSPSIDGLKNSEQLLTLIGALDSKTSRITIIGQLLIKLPIEPFLSRAIIEGLIFQQLFSNPMSKLLVKMSNQEQRKIKQYGITQTIIEILATIINFSNLFFIKFQQRQKAQRNKFNRFSDEEGDFFYLHNIYLEYKSLEKPFSGLNDKNKHRSIMNWCKDNFLNFKALNNIKDLIYEISTIIKDFTIDDKRYNNTFNEVKQKYSKCTSFKQIILSCMITSFGPNLCKYSGNPNIGYTIVNQRRPVQIYGTSNLSLLGINSDWIICYDLITNQLGRNYCKMAQNVSFQFMKNHLYSYIWKKYDIDGMAKESPFYKVISFKLPTKFIHQLRSLYHERQRESKGYTADCIPFIKEQKNEADFYIVVKDKKTTKVHQEQIQAKIKNLRKQVDGYYLYNYMGNCYAQLVDGLQIKALTFKNKEYKIQVTATQAAIDQILDLVQDVGKIAFEDVKQNSGFFGALKSLFFKKTKLSIFIMDSYQSRVVQNSIINFKHKYSDLILKVSEVQIEQNKLPNLKIIMKFFAGSNNKNNLLMHYPADKSKYNETTIQKIVGQLQRLKGKNLSYIFDRANCSVTKNLKGINLASCQYDQCEVQEELLRLISKGDLKYDFVMPQYIKKFRDADPKHAYKSDETWMQQIEDLLAKQSIKREEVSISIRGNYSSGSNRQEGGQSRVQMIAELTTSNSLIYNKLKEAYNGRKHILGCEKVHVTGSFDCLLQVATKKSFDCLYEEFLFIVDKFKENVPLLYLYTIDKRVKNKDKKVIYARSPNKEDFIQIQKQLSELFCPKLIKLDPIQFTILEKMEEGSVLLQNIESMYNYRIYFGFDKMLTSIKLYCQEDIFEQIKSKLMSGLNKCRNCTDRISFRGKNIIKIQELLDGYKYVKHKILFQDKIIEITSDPQTLIDIKTKIQSIGANNTAECIICEDTLKSPYRLIYCECQFCWACLATYVRQFSKDTTAQTIRCPSSKCKALINVHDLKTILTQEEFEKICDIKLLKHAQTQTLNYIICQYCDNILETKEIMKTQEMNCEVCGKSECLKCKRSHKGSPCLYPQKRNNYLY